MTSKTSLAIVSTVLLVLFTLVEYVTLFYWFQYGNNGPQSAFFIGLLVEHFLSLLAGVVFGMAMVAKTTGLRQVSMNTGIQVDAKTLVILFAEVMLGAYILLPWTDATYKPVAIGAFVGLIGGHLNGARSSPVKATMA